MAVPAVLVVAIVSGDLLASLVPVRVLGVPLSDHADHPVYQAVARDAANGGIEQLIQIALDVSLRFNRGDHLRAVDRFAVMTDAARPPREIGGPFRIARRYHCPAIDEDLRADLLGHDLTVCGN